MTFDLIHAVATVTFIVLWQLERAEARRMRAERDEANKARAWWQQAAEDNLEQWSRATRRWLDAVDRQPAWSAESRAELQQARAEFREVSERREARP